MAHYPSERDIPPAERDPPLAERDKPPLLHRGGRGPQVREEADNSMSPHRAPGPRASEPNHPE